ncbi:hypothetical protein NITLEN_11086 [Nitrospira lenta]|uniref:Uncharacterized protein n=1 Tax=Nitrospira lenta TaxID=1436998 RepID=A0A330L2N5_9BACT|nr:hypothetical protein NITLEN_11086 [Nitrospira lenta]
MGSEGRTFNATPSLPQQVCRVAKTGELPTYSGGTAPVFHRTSLLRPSGHPRDYSIISQDT